MRYPIETIRTVDNYPGADDELSMEANNTSAFNCRDIPGTGRWAHTHSVEPSTSTRCSIPTSIGRVRSNPRTPRPTSTATAPTPASYTRVTLSFASSPIVAGAGAVTGELPRTISTLSDDRHMAVVNSPGYWNATPLITGSGAKGVAVAAVWWRRWRWRWRWRSEQGTVIGGSPGISTTVVPTAGGGAWDCPADAASEAAAVVPAVSRC